MSFILLLCFVVLLSAAVPFSASAQQPTEAHLRAARRAERAAMKAAVAEQKKSRRVPVPASVTDTLSFEGRIRRFFDYQHSLLSEKLWLHTDKPYYGAGEMIWYKGYLVGGITHRAEDAPSNFIYVELLDRKDSVVIREKIKRDTLTGTFHSGMKIPADFPAGEYVLRGYTRWMQNNDPGFFFLKRLLIGNSIAMQITSRVEYTEDKPGQMAARLHVYTENGETLGGRRYQYRIRDKEGRLINLGTRRSDDYGIVDFPIPQRRQKTDWYMEVELLDDPLEYKRTLYLPSSLSEFSVQFFPEGGNLLGGVLQQVAFKGQGPDGTSVESKGYLLDSRGDTVVRFESEHDGMGRFSMAARKGETYTAVATTPEGHTRTFPFPAVHDRGIVLAAVQTDKEIRFEVLRAEDTPVEPLWLVVHTRGMLQVLESLAGKQSGIIPAGKLPEGIAHLLLVDEAGVPQSERLIFIRHAGEEPCLEIRATPEKYATREKVTLRFDLSDRNGWAQQGDLSVSVTDRRTVRLDSAADNIRSNLLLVSDLKGYVENPGYYFQDEGPRLRLDRDLLMLTHGWRRFRTDDLVSRPANDFKRIPERTQYVMGNVVSSETGKPEAGAVVALSAPQAGIFRTATSDGAGRFYLDGLDFRDTVSAGVFAYSVHNREWVKPILQPDSVAYVNKVPLLIRPEQDRFRNELTAFSQYGDDALGLYLAHAREAYFQSGGEPVYNIATVTVTEARPKTQYEQSHLQNWKHRVYDEERINRTIKGSLLDYLKTIPHVAVLTDTLGSPYLSMTVMINDHQFLDSSSNYYPELESIPLDDVESVVTTWTHLDMITPSSVTARYDPGSANILVYLKKNHAIRRPNLVKVILQGYDESAEFYSPAYDTPDKKHDPKPDLRTTLYWNPDVRVGADGVARVEFYSHDSPRNGYEITVEGVTESGKPVYARYSIE